MAAKLSEITSEYRSFVDNQVLTADQLNQVVNHLTDQDRLSRIYLSGVGIVCGFNLTVSGISGLGDAALITLSQGTGITTDGDLLKLSTKSAVGSTRDIAVPKKDFQLYRAFEDKFAQYTHFKDENGDQIPLWELVAEDEKTSSDDEQTVTTSFLQEKVVLLYLESYSKTPDVCTTVDCDNQGVLEVARVRVLLADEKAVKQVVNNKDDVFRKFDLNNNYRRLPELIIQKVNVLENNQSSLNQLRSKYQTTITTGKAQLSQAIAAIFDNFNAFITINSSKNNVLSLLNMLNISSDNEDRQYYYDVVRDLMDTYQEIKQVLFDMSSQCSVNKRAFPKHLLLGRFNEVAPYKTLRHGFYKSPIIPSDYENIQKFNFLLSRFQEQLKNFNEPSIPTNTKVELPIKITPSLKSRELGLKAIPFYYQTDEQLVKLWNYDKSRRFLHKFNLGYHSVNLEYKTPFDFSFEDHNFYRIEGIHGKNYDIVHKDLDTLRKKLGLSFDIQLISTDESLEELDLEKHQCHFADLDMQYKAWQTQIACLLANVTQFFSGFSTKPNGGHNYVATDFFADKKRNISIDSNVDNPIRSEATGSLREEKEKIPATSFSDFPQKKEVLKHRPLIRPYLLIEKEDLGFVLQNNIDDCATHSAPQMLVSQNGFEIEDYNARIAYPMNFLFKSSKIVQLIPERISRIDRFFIRDFRVTTDSLCKDINKTTEEINKLFNNPKSTYTKQGFEARYVKVLDDIRELCCAVKFLETLNDEMERRKKELFERLSFEQFAKRHPGMEHWAGVSEGGTFVLVYGGKKSKHAGQVIADFALPYMCCSDCAPINFVIAERELATSFELDKTEICLDQSQKSVAVAFNLSPKDAALEILGTPEGITIENQNIVIDPKKFTRFNDPIHFVVNGNTANQTLLVHQKPAVEPKGNLAYLRNEKGEYAEGKLYFDNINNFDTDKYTYVWTLVSDKDYNYSYTGISPRVKIPKELFNLKEDKANLKFTLQVSGGFCEPGQSDFEVSFDIPKEEPDKECTEIVQQRLKDHIATLQNQRRTNIYKEYKQHHQLHKHLLDQYKSVYELGENLVNTNITNYLYNIHESMQMLVNLFYESKSEDEKMFLAMMFSSYWQFVVELLRCQDNILGEKETFAVNEIIHLMEDNKSQQIINAESTIDKKQKSLFLHAVNLILADCKSDSVRCNFMRLSKDLLTK